MVQDVELSVRVATCTKLNALDTHNDVFQRLCIQTDFGMGDIGIDDDKVVDIDGVELILDQKLSFAACDIEKLQMVMSMGYRVLVSAVLGTGNIQ